MSLREEIYKILDSDDAYNKYENIDIDYCIDKILKLFEKRIDDIIQIKERGIDFAKLKQYDVLERDLHNDIRLLKTEVKEMLK